MSLSTEVRHTAAIRPITTETCCYSRNTRPHTYARAPTVACPGLTRPIVCERRAQQQAQTHAKRVRAEQRPESIVMTVTLTRHTVHITSCWPWTAESSTHPVLILCASRE